ncbi:MAG: hypothetical protein ABFD83_06650 [Armatimonadota bacterium]
MVWPYSSLGELPLYPDTTGYGNRWINDALEAGFCFLGWASDLKGKMYKMSYAMLVSREGDCLAVIGFGYVLNVRVQGTTLYCQATNGNVFYTSDNQALIEIDLSRTWHSQLTQAFTFSDLLKYHRKILSTSGAVVQMFTAGREIEEMKRLREQRYQSLSKMGLITYTDALCEYWHYTTYGAIRVAFVNYWIGMMRKLTFGRMFKSV